MQLNMLAGCILFALPLNATQDDALAVIDSIAAQFGVTDFGRTGTISPQDAFLEGITTRTDAVDNAVAALTGTGPEVDAAGTPWDERIHASTKTKTAKGIWTKRKGVDDATFAKVMKAITATTAAPAAPNAAPPAVTAVPPPPAPAPIAPAVPPPPAPVVTRYTQFVNFLSPHIRSEANPNSPIDDTWVQQTLAAFGIPDGTLPNLAHATDAKIDEIETAIRASFTAAGLI
jgi:hypothetical protein